MTLSLKTALLYTHEKTELQKVKNLPMDSGGGPFKTGQTQPWSLFCVLCQMSGLNELRVKAPGSCGYTKLCLQGLKPPFSLSWTLTNS